MRHLGRPRLRTPRGKPGVTRLRKDPAHLRAGRDALGQEVAPGEREDRGGLRPEADLDELSMALLTALQGGTLLGQTMQSTASMQASMNAALRYVESFAA